MPSLKDEIARLRELSSKPIKEFYGSVLIWSAALANAYPDALAVIAHQERMLQQAREALEYYRFLEPEGWKAQAAISLLDPNQDIQQESKEE